MANVEIITSKFPLGNTVVEIRSECNRARREMMDTEVRIGGEIVCIISGDNIDEFTFELRKLIDKFRI